MKTLAVYCKDVLEMDDENIIHRLLKDMKIDHTRIIQYHDANEFDEDMDIVVLAMVNTLDDIKVYDDIDRFINDSPEQIDNLQLGTHLQLIKELGFKERIKVIGIPEHGNILELRDALADILVDIRKEWQH